MKKTLYLIVSIFSLILISCSSTYKVSDFSSKDKFYEDFNKSVNGKAILVILNNDSSFITERGAEISNDSLLFITQVQKEKNINKSEIENIKYSGSDMSNLTATILLKNGKLATTKNASILSDSSINAYTSENIYYYFPINNVKEISYKNHWLGVPVGFLSGTISGLIAGIAIYSINPPTNTWEGNWAYIPGGSVLGLIVGSVWGWLNGHTYTYQFNP